MTETLFIGARGMLPSSEMGGVVAWRGDGHEMRSEAVAVEEPMEIRLAGCSVAVTMRTPGNDLDLAAGFLFTEGIIRGPEDIASITHCATDDPEAQLNVVNVNPTEPSVVEPERWRRNFFAGSSCGICGKASIEAIHQETVAVLSRARVPHRVLDGLEGAMREAQTVFAETGGLHAAVLFDLDGRLLTAREDIGRHNAVDKIVGDALRSDRLPLDERILMVSGRASFEIAQKALMAGIPIVAAVSAPSSLAIDLARSADMTLVGFLRSGRFNVYTGTERIV